MIEDSKIMTYRAWAPDQSKWTAWAKPVLFASMINSDFDTDPIDTLPSVDYVDYIDEHTFVILDLPGKQSVLEALALAHKGYQPVPLYNGTRCKNPLSMLVDVSELTKFLYHGGIMLEALSIRSDATPVFMLDSRRMEDKNPAPGKYDNRWCIFAQDLPSGLYLKNAGFTKVLIRSRMILDDLSHVLVRYQKAGIEVIIKNQEEGIHPVQVHRPYRYKSLLYRSSILLGFRRNATGGFGGQIPEPMEYNSGIGYRGLG